MRGMYLASHQVGHHVAHWFVVTVRVNPVLAERKVVCVVNVGFTSAPSSARTAAEEPVCVTILFVSKPQACMSMHWTSFTNGVSSVLPLRCTGFFTEFTLSGLNGLFVP